MIENLARRKFEKLIEIGNTGKYGYSNQGLWTHIEKKRLEVLKDLTLKMSAILEEMRDEKDHKKNRKLQKRLHEINWAMTSMLLASRGDVIGMLKAYPGFESKKEA
ncbi:MAG: hypothetical protein A2052_03710 [Deltaproteobacteria bacterium GWA2_54_12]|nr:MAG: hypothetical protein A2052_03710 [Deltaproteobacteria bacterium GWA2_54_12]